MTEDEKMRLVSEYDEDLGFDTGDDVDIETLDGLLEKIGKSAKQAQRDCSDFMMWFEAMKKRLDITNMQKALFCRKLCEELTKEYSYDYAKLWCLCLSEHSDFLFEERDDDDGEYRLYQFLKLSGDIDDGIRRLGTENGNKAEFLRMTENITFADKPLIKLNSETLCKAMTEVYGIDGEHFKENMEYICGKISSSEELVRILPNVFYALFVRYPKKLTDTEGFEPNFKSALRYTEYEISKDNGKNQTAYEEHLDLYENLCAYFDECSKALCDAGFVCMSNLCENGNLPWYEYPDFIRPLEAELRERYFTCFPNGLEDNPVFTANDIDVGDIAAFEDFYEEKLPPKCRVTDKARKYLEENDDAAERYIALLESGETDKCMQIVHDIIERSEINPEFVKPEMVNLTNAVIMEEVLENISLRTKEKLLELLPVLRENIEKER